MPPGTRSRGDVPDSLWPALPLRARGVPPGDGVCAAGAGRLHGLREPDDRVGPRPAWSRPKASELSREQLAQAGSRPSRTRGLSLRALALTTHPSKRTALLRESAEILRDSGARLELAYTFNDLSNAYQALGEHSRAHWAARQARNLAERCGARALNVALHETELGVPETGDGTVAQFSRLSDAEQRVAALAACGYKNNQIAHKLFITVSTVEQHLTRVYRKLGVAGRAELPIKIEPRSPNEPAARVNYAAATPWPY